MISMSENLVLNVLWRHRCDWEPAYTFFNWVSKQGNRSGYLLGSDAYNQILDIVVIGNQVLDEMSQRKGLVNERTYGIVLKLQA